ncbi:MAG: hypothetical protein KAH25_11305, partial [Bacteroidales bacterium]|nr:hypothetical protein [Bacteroidales bacterium]
MKTYRDILKWGNKEEIEIDRGTRALIKNKLGFSDEHFNTKHLAGDHEIVLNNTNNIPPTIQQQLSDIVGKENISTQADILVEHAYGKSYPELLKLRKGLVDTPP